jgi:hypothetical protein
VRAELIARVAEHFAIGERLDVRLRVIRKAQQFGGDRAD